MSEEKLYAIKNDEGEWADTHRVFGKSAWAIPYKIVCEEQVKHYGGHVVTLVEKPEKVVLSKEQAEIVEKAHVKVFPATFIYGSNEGDEELLMNAYVNGYTVEKEKKYNVKVPHTKDVWYYKDSETYLQTICSSDKELHGKFTAAEIEHYGLQDCERVVCADSARTTGEEE